MNFLHISSGSRDSAKLRASCHSQRRKGAAGVLIIIMLMVFVVSAAITIDYAYMQLVRTEMRAATDAAAKAGAEALTRTENISVARAEAVRFAAANTVGGQSFRLSTNDIQIGRVVASSAGRWDFVSGASPPNAIRVNARTGGSALHSAVPLFFSRVLGRESFTPNYQATAGQQEVEVCLCLDRSGSMCFDMSGVDWAYPPNNPFLSNYTAEGWTMRNYYSPPNPVGSRWTALASSVRLFLNEASNYSPPPRTALVTWANEFTVNAPLYKTFSTVTTDIALPASTGHSWAANRLQVETAVAQLGVSPMVGGTNLSGGLDRAVAVLRGTNSNSLSSKVIILVTDGQWNAGRNPQLAANDARMNGITVHCISMITGYQAILQSVATTTGGRYFATNDDAGLRAAFQEIAKSLPVVLTD